MNNEIWPVCREHKHCTICRRRNPVGLQLRTSMRRFIDPGTTDFLCPDGLPWLSERLTPAELSVFSRKVDDVVMAKLVQKENNITPRFSPTMLQILVVQHFAVRSILPEGHAIVKALDDLIVSMASPHGCKGCRHKRLMRTIAQAVDAASDEDRRKLLPLVTAA